MLAYTSQAMIFFPKQEANIQINTVFTGIKTEEA